MQLELPDLREAIIAHDSFDKPAIIVMGGIGIGRRSRHAELTPQSDKSAGAVAVGKLTPGWIH
jgi:hypothetical protein